MSTSVESALDGLVERLKQVHQQEDVPMVVQFDPRWSSPTHTENAQEGEWVEWQPVIRQEAVSFDALEEALELAIHPDLKAYFAYLWSDNIKGKTKKGELDLLFPWNPEDFERLQQNLVGHVLMKRRLGQGVTLFFAVTDEEDFIITLDNTTGQVMLEQVGLEPTQSLASSLSDFIQSVQPVAR